MKALKSILYLAVISMLFVGSVGLDVFKHICEDDGVSVAYVFNTIEHCDDHHEEVPPCCEEKGNDDCCDDEVEYIQMKLDFFQDQENTSDYIQVDFQTPIVVNEINFIRKSFVQSYSNTDPPPKRLSERLAINQSYLI